MPTPPTSGADHEISAARELGRLEAESFDLRLREIEQREREARLARLLLAGEDNAQESELAESWQLQRDVKLLAGFHSAVLRSRGWRLLQALRRPLGRAW